MDILDFHTHRTDADRAIISVDPHEFSPEPGRWYSVGFHPWSDLEALGEDDFALLEQCAGHPQVLAIGETGLDSLRGAPLDLQEAAYARHLRLAASVGKPVVVHSVRTVQRILAVKRATGCQVPLAIHGMRGNEHVARLLLDAGCYLSFGIRFNPSALRITPLDRLFIETDDYPAAISEVAAAVASEKGLSCKELTELTAANIRRFTAAGTY